MRIGLEREDKSMLRFRFVRQVGRLTFFGIAPFILGGTADADPPHPLYTLRVHAIKVADDDGRRAADITSQQVKAWVDKANSIYAAAGIQFRFDPNPNGSDWSNLNNTNINNLSSSNSATWGTANALAAQYPSSLVVFFRYGTGATPTGNGFAFPPRSGLMTNFVAMPGFNNTWVITGKDAANQWIWQQNIWLFAHEVGNYLGLKHTFVGWDDSTTETPDKASHYLAAHDHTENALDGDGLRDTPPEAGTAFYVNQGWDPCRGHDSYAITGKYVTGPANNRTEVPFTCNFRPDRHNMMSYFACDPMHFTPMQIDLMRQTLQERLAQASLTGTWTGDDGGIYYIRQIDDTIWWAGLSTESPQGKNDFYKGLRFTNVFRGTIEGNTIRGKWADVPRGANLQNGTLTLSIVNSSAPGGIELRKQNQWGGFGGNIWQRVRPTPPPPCEESVTASSPDIHCKFDHAISFSGANLLKDLKPEKDNVVVFGAVTPYGEWPEGPSLRVGWPKDDNSTYQVTYLDFLNACEHNDGDTNFNIEYIFGVTSPVCLNGQPNFWTEGWLYDGGALVVRSKLEAPWTDQSPGKGMRPHNIHCEISMYARARCDGAVWPPCPSREGPAREAACGGLPLLPGWMESGANSVLWNGTPINGNVQGPEGPGGGKIRGTTFPVGARGRTIVRVTGVLSIDCGHSTVTEGLSPCYDDIENGFVQFPGANVNNVEIHPVYAVDVAQDWTRRSSSNLSGANADLTGVWAASDVGTYYVRQVGDEVWWLGLSRDQGRTFANIFHGSAVSRGGDGEGLARPIIVGDWANVRIGENGSMNSGQLRMGGSFCVNPYSPDNFNIYRPPCDVSRPLPQWNILETQFTSNDSFRSIHSGEGFRWLKLFDWVTAGTPSPNR